MHTPYLMMIRSGLLRINEKKPSLLKIIVKTLEEFIQKDVLFLLDYIFFSIDITIDADIFDAISLNS